METPIQEMINKLDYLIGLSEGTLEEFGLKTAKKQAEALLEKEEEVIINANIAGMEFIPVDPNRHQEDAEQYYNETFKTKER